LSQAAFTREIPGLVTATEGAMAADNIETGDSRDGMQSEKTRPGPQASRPVPPHVLRRRYGEFSTAGAYVLLHVKNRETGECAHVVHENMDWYLIARDEGIFIGDADEEYVDFMVKNHDRLFEVGDASYTELLKLDAPEREAYARLKSKGIPYLVDAYLTRWYWNAPKNTGPYVYNITEEKYAYDESFLRVLLEMGLVVRRECESGQRYVEPEEIDEPGV
jgi:hypothetical protein